MSLISTANILNTRVHSNRGGSECSQTLVHSTTEGSNCNGTSDWARHSHFHNVALLTNATLKIKYLLPTCLQLATKDDTRVSQVCQRWTRGVQKTIATMVLDVVSNFNILLFCKIHTATFCGRCCSDWSDEAALRAHCMYK